MSQYHKRTQPQLYVSAQIHSHISHSLAKLLDHIPQPYMTLMKEVLLETTTQAISLGVVPAGCHEQASHVSITCTQSKKQLAPSAHLVQNNAYPKPLHFLVADIYRKENLIHTSCHIMRIVPTSIGSMINSQRG